MKYFFVLGLLAVLFLCACKLALIATPVPESSSVPTLESSSDLQVDDRTIPKLPQKVSCQIQYTGELDLDLDMEVFNALQKN